MSAGEKERAHHPYTNHHHHKHLSHSHIANYHWHCRFCCCCCCKHQHISRKTTPSFPQKDEMSATWWLMVIKRIQICVLIDICTQDASLALVVPFSLACSLARSLPVLYLQMWQSHHHYYVIHWLKSIWEQRRSLPLPFRI